MIEELNNALLTTLSKEMNVPEDRIRERRWKLFAIGVCAEHDIEPPEIPPHRDSPIAERLILRVRPSRRMLGDTPYG